MRHLHGLRRPPVIRAALWWTGLALWAITFLALTFLGVRSPILGSLAESSTQLPSHVRAWAEQLIDARAVPEPAPDFTLALFDGTSFRLTGYRGQIVVVNFWASWCPPCQREAARFEADSRRYRARGVVFVGIDVEDSDVAARAFLREYGITYANGPDRSLQINASYGVSGLPTTVVIDRQGRVRQRWLGELQENQLTSFIEEALK